MPSPLTQILAPALFPFPTLPSTPPTGPVSGLDLAGAGSVLEAVLVLGATVGFHELGHFIAARSQGIHVSKFSIGFGPALVRVQRGEVEYALRALPLGGYVGFPDDDPNSTIPKGGWIEDGGLASGWWCVVNLRGGSSACRHVELEDPLAMWLEGRLLHAWHS